MRQMTDFTTSRQLMYLGKIMADVPDVTPEMRHRVLLDDLSAILVHTAKSAKRQDVPEAFVPDLMCLQQEVLRHKRYLQSSGTSCRFADLAV